MLIYILIFPIFTIVRMLFILYNQRKAHDILRAEFSFTHDIRYDPQGYYALCIYQYLTELL